MARSKKAAQRYEPIERDTITVQKPFQLLFSLLTDPQYFASLASLVILGDALLTSFIIQVIPYTEIDWETYMRQIEVIAKGQLAYNKIEGPTGPLVYPAGHVHIHELLYAVTDGGSNIQLAQYIYAALYLLTLAVTCGIYSGAGNIPNWVLLLLPLSKRLHSIFVLRLFNDCWTALPMSIAVLAYQFGMDDTGTFFLAAALSVKMSVMLYVPGILLILFKRKGLFTAARHVITIVAIQYLLGARFLVEDSRAYWTTAFDLSRQFLYKWTVNWRFIDEQQFLSQGWARGLLIGHLVTLVIFALFKWCRPDGGPWPVIKKGLWNLNGPAGRAPVSADFVATTLLTSNLIGIIFARSLHYQFYSWYALQIPFIAWRTPYPIVVKIALKFAIEYAWNVYPSTPLSSYILLGSNVLLLVGVFFNKEEQRSAQKVVTDAQDGEKEKTQ